MTSDVERLRARSIATLKPARSSPCRSGALPRRRRRRTAAVTIVRRPPCHSSLSFRDTVILSRSSRQDHRTDPRAHTSPECPNLIPAPPHVFVAVQPSGSAPEVIIFPPVSIVGALSDLVLNSESVFALLLPPTNPHQPPFTQRRKTKRSKTCVPSTSSLSRLTSR